MELRNYLAKTLLRVKAVYGTRYAIVPRLTAQNITRLEVWPARHTKVSAISACEISPRIGFICDCDIYKRIVNTRHSHHNMRTKAVAKCASMYTSSVPIATAAWKPKDVTTCPGESCSGKQLSGFFGPRYHAKFHGYDDGRPILEVDPNACPATPDVEEKEEAKNTDDESENNADKNNDDNNTDNSTELSVLTNQSDSSSYYEQPSA
ncbi:hypothetical protein EDC01DRAFT_634133 [Geopyxis carbonaria]|nr:hypothetical protein EDC01DRAFT_634133 [Geopyxis carbonaria]